jgi:hypothetical protein
MLFEACKSRAEKAGAGWGSWAEASSLSLLGVMGDLGGSSQLVSRLASGKLRLLKKMATEIVSFLI